ncbi:MAG: hypothetical protein QXU18_00110 [Thermoplasmatales archaeon]
MNGKIVQGYVGYLDKYPNSKNEIEPEEIVKYVERMWDKKISWQEISEILKKIGIEYDAMSITKAMILHQIFLKLK